MYKITKEFHFSASHKLDGLADGHPCQRHHGHNYLVKVELSNAVLNNVGFVLDYRELDVIKNWIDDTFDHQHLNEVLPFNPTAENMCKYFFNHIRAALNVWQVTAVEISETPKTNSRYSE